jgi:hypothetical protein
LGHIISRKIIDVDPTKIEAIMEWTTPTNLHELHMFMGLGSYYMRFIEFVFGYFESFYIIAKEK